MTTAQQKEIIYRLAVESAAWREKRNKADRNLRRLRAEAAAVLDSPQRKRRPALAERQGNQGAIPSIPRLVTGRKQEITADWLAYLRHLAHDVHDALADGDTVRAAVLSGEIAFLTDALVWEQKGGVR